MRVKKLINRTYKSYKTYRSHNRILLLLMAVLFTAPLLHAEDFFRVKDSIIQNAWLKTSLFYLAPGLRLTGMGYNTNIYSYESLESPDWTADLGLELNLAVILKNRLILQIKESPSYSLYAENDDERAFNNIFQLSAYTRAGRFNIKYEFENAYVRQQVNPETGWRVRGWEDNHTLSIDYGNMDRFFINVYLGQNKFAFEDELFLDSFNMNRLFNRTEYWVGIGLNKIVFTRSRFTFQYEYFDQRFQFSPQRDRTGQQFSMGFIFPAGSRITGTLRYGLRFIRPDTTFYRDFIAPFGIGTIGIRLMSRLSLHATYRLDNHYSFAGVDLYYDTRTVGGGLTYRLSRRLRLSYDLSAGRRSYRLLSGGGETRRDDFYISSAVLSVQLAERSEMGIEYRAYRSDSTHLRFLRSYDYIGGYIRYDL